MCPTGMAASVIDGMTICSSLDLHFENNYKALTDQKLALFKPEFQEFELIIIDKMSMLSADDLYKKHHRLVDIFNNNLPFGRIGIIFVCDMLQLKPVRDRFMLEKPKDQKLNRLRTKLHLIELVGVYLINYKPSITSYGTVDDMNLYQTLNIKIGSRVIVVLNINTVDSLIYGSMGTVLDIIVNDEKVTFIIVKFDCEKAGVEQRR